MYISITLILLVLAAITMAGLRLSRPSASYSWLAAALGGLLGWVSVLAWQINLPRQYTPSTWSPSTLFGTSPVLLVDEYAWVYALCLVTVAAAVLLTSPARMIAGVKPIAWAGTLLITVVGLLAILADNPLTLVLVWSAIDLAEFMSTLRASDSASLSERSVVAFFVRSAGTGLALWASVVNATSGMPFLFESLSSQPGIYLLLAAGLRLGVLPLHLTFRSEPLLRRGFGTTLRLATAATSLVLLARLPFTAIDTNFTPAFLALAAVAALYSSWKWLSATDALSGRPYWIIGMSSLALAATLRGNPAGSAAWGAAMLLFGAISFLYSARQARFSRVLAGLGILLLGLPFTLTGAGWQGAFRWPFAFWPLFLIAHLMLVGGYVIQILKPGENQISELPAWARASYPAGMALPVVSAIIASGWGWPGALQVGAWLVAAIQVVLVTAVAVLGWRLGLFKEIRFELPSAGVNLSSGFGDMQDALVRFFWALYGSMGRLSGYVASLLEGDGGLLWTLVLLVLLISIISGFGQNGGLVR